MDDVNRPNSARKRKADKEEREAKRDREMAQIRQFVSHSRRRVRLPTLVTSTRRARLKNATQRNGSDKDKDGRAPT